MARHTFLLMFIGMLTIGCGSARGYDDDDDASDDDDAGPTYTYTSINYAAWVFEYRAVEDGTVICSINHFGSDQSSNEVVGVDNEGATHYFYIQYTLDPDSSCFSAGLEGFTYNDWIESNPSTLVGVFSLVPSTLTDATLYMWSSDPPGWQPAAIGSKVGDHFEAEDEASEEEQGVEFWIVWEIDW